MTRWRTRKERCFTPKWKYLLEQLRLLLTPYYVAEKLKPLLSVFDV